VKYTIIDEDDISLIENFGFEPRVDIDRNGLGARVYAYVYSLKEGKETARCLHNMLWEKYRGVISPGYKVVHKNGITVDNRLDNLTITKSVDYTKLKSSCHGNLYYTAICQLPEDLINEQFSERVARSYDANGQLCSLENERDTLYECRYPPCSNMEQVAGQFAVCGRCRSSRYCGNICQQKDWTAHRKHCCRAILHQNSSYAPDSPDR